MSAGAFFEIRLAPYRMYYDRMRLLGCIEKKSGLLYFFEGFLAIIRAVWMYGKIFVKYITGF